MKYARIERERRFLLGELPSDLPQEYRCIRDWYIDGTRLRLRRVESASGDVLARKFTQKFASSGSTFRRTTITNFYLDEQEFDRLRQLGGRLIVKHRYGYSDGTNTIAIDVFMDHLRGLMTAEVEFGNDTSMTEFSVPEFAIADVTEQVCFTGGYLANADREELHRELARWGVNLDNVPAITTRTAIP